MRKATLAVGNQRLLRLAEILDTADAEHKERGEPTYDQWVFCYPDDRAVACGSPACALGHWAAANPRRWRWNVFRQPVLKNGTGETVSDAELEFCLDMERHHNNDTDWDRLFSGGGCGGAHTAKQAAQYIRRFVMKRKRQAARKSK